MYTRIKGTLVAKINADITTCHVALNVRGSPPPFLRENMLFLAEDCIIYHVYPLLFGVGGGIKLNHSIPLLFLLLSANCFFWLIALKQTYHRKVHEGSDPPLSPVNYKKPSLRKICERLFFRFAQRTSATCLALCLD